MSRHRSFLRSMRYTDQHGRPYASVIDTRTALPIDTLMPQFSAPLMPRSYLLKLSADALGKTEVDYEKWLADVKFENERWLDLMSKYAVETYGDRAGEMMENPTAAMLKAAGPKPLSPVLVEAAKAGNPWVLGLPQKDGTPYPKDFIPSWAKGHYEPPRDPREQYFVDDDEVPAFLDGVAEDPAGEEGAANETQVSPRGRRR